MTMNWKCILWITSILIVIGFFIVKILPIFLPIKYAVNEADLLGKNGYVICEVVKSTGENWVVVGGADDRYQSGVSLADVQGENPFKTYSYAIEAGHNRYVFYGDYIYLDSYEIHGGIPKNAILFQSDQWDILYPIQRNDLISFLLSKRYLCLYDTEYTFDGLRKLMKGRYLWNYKTLPLPQ